MALSLVVASGISENVSAFGGLLVGVAAVASSLLSLRGVKRRAKDECDQRIEDIIAAFRRGTTYQKRKEEPDDG